MGRPWGFGAKVIDQAITEGYWDENKRFVEGRPSNELLNEFKLQLEKARCQKIGLQ